MGTNTDFNFEDFKPHCTRTVQLPATVTVCLLHLRSRLFFREALENRLKNLLIYFRMEAKGRGSKYNKLHVLIQQQVSTYLERDETKPRVTVKCDANVVA